LKPLGLLGFWNSNADKFDAAEVLQTGLYGIQHRGQQSGGICVNDKGRFIYHKELGLVSEIFDDIVIRHLRGGSAGVAHVGYLTKGEVSRENAQPIVMKYSRGQMALAFDGNLLNMQKLRASFEEKGHFFQSGSPAEIAAAMLSMERVNQHSIEDAQSKVMHEMKGAFSLLVMTPRKLMAVRDTYGVKPLCIGKLAESYVFASESCALDAIGAEFVRDVLPGEIVVASETGCASSRISIKNKSALCVFELVYFARSDSYIDGVSVFRARMDMGAALARESPAPEADIVIGAPDSAIPAALGYALASGIPYTEGLIKNRYIGRTFIQPGQTAREAAVYLKLNPQKSQVSGKSLVLVEDSIVRGTTTKRVINLLKQRGGAREVHVRVGSPMVRFPCYYGIDTRDGESLIANKMKKDEICAMLGADSLEFLSHDGLMSVTRENKCNHCTACFSGNYPISATEGSND